MIGPFVVQIAFYSLKSCRFLQTTGRFRERLLKNQIRIIDNSLFIYIFVFSIWDDLHKQIIYVNMQGTEIYECLPWASEGGGGNFSKVRPNHQAHRITEVPCVEISFSKFKRFTLIL